MVIGGSVFTQNKRCRHLLSMQLSLAIVDGGQDMEAPTGSSEVSIERSDCSSHFVPNVYMLT